MDVTVGTVAVAGITAAASLALGLINRRAQARTNEATEQSRSHASERMDALREHIAQLQDRVTALVETARLSTLKITECSSSLRECIRERDALERERIALLKEIAARGR